jgi:hypothetical protein
VRRFPVFGGGGGGVRIGAHTPTRRDDEATHAWFGVETADASFGDRESFDRHDPVHPYDAHADGARTPVLRPDVGADDPWRPSIEWFRGRLDERGVPHESRVPVGAGHGTADHGFWTRHAADALRFSDRAFAQGRRARLAGVG